MDETTSLAISLHSSKGVYAVLLGSGMSNAARVLTGRGVMSDLIRKLAVCQGALDQCSSDDDAEGWYIDRYGETPDYSALLEKLTKTPAERRALLRGYFEPSDAEREEGAKVPTPAHEALAELVAGGYVKVVITTNFDQLAEQALRATGVTPAVVSTPDAVNGMEPLPHARCTVVKLHGDYMDARLLNTPDELDTYDPAFDKLLDQIFDEFGLIVCGWSAKYDTALRRAIERAPNRRYSTYWAHRGKLEDEAQRLIGLRHATPIPGKTADEFFVRLAADVKSLEELGGRQLLTSKVAAQSAKRYLTNTFDRIRLHDLVMGEAIRVRSIVDGPNALPLDGPSGIEPVVERMRILERECAPLMALFAVAGYWADEEQLNLWKRALYLLIVGSPSGGRLVAFGTLRNYPALLATYAFCTAAVAAGRTDRLVALLLAHQGMDWNTRNKVPFVVAVNTSTVLELQQKLPGYGQKMAPFSSWLLKKAGLREVLMGLPLDEHTFEECFDQFEYLLGLLIFDFDGFAPVGSFIERGRLGGTSGSIPAVRALNAEVEKTGEAWPPFQSGAFDGSLDRLKAVQVAYESNFSTWLR